MLDLRTLRLSVGESHREDIPVTLERFSSGGVAYEAIPGRFPAWLRVTRMPSGLLFDLGFDGSVFGPCQRCLEEARTDLRVDAREYQAHTPEPGTEIDTTSPYVDGELLDVDRWAQDALLLAMPVKVLCREDCAGLCPTCGSDLNAGDCGCEPVPDARWSKLRDLL